MAETSEEPSKRPPVHVVRDEVFCSRIVHQNSSHQSRFTWSNTFRAIMAHACPDCPGPDGAGRYPRPLSSPFPCFQCHMKFDNAPCFIPYMVLSGTRTEWGNFCDPSCALRYLHQNNNDADLAEKVAELYEYCQDVLGWEPTVSNPRIVQAPHFTMRAAYGGPLTDEQFLMAARTPGLFIKERFAPFIPTPSVVEWQCCLDVGPQSGFGAVGGALGSAQKATSGPQHGSGARTSTGVDGSRASDSHEDECAASTTTASASERLAALLGTTEHNSAKRHHWEVTGLRRPPEEDIRARLASLPQPAKKVGSYELYWARKMAEAEEQGGVQPGTGNGSGVAGALTAETTAGSGTAAPKTPAKKRPRKGTGATKTSASPTSNERELSESGAVAQSEGGPPATVGTTKRRKQTSADVSASP